MVNETVTGLRKYNWPLIMVGNYKLKEVRSE